MSLHPGTSRRRFWIACLALVANLVAAGVPVLHAFAHHEHVAAQAHHHDEADLHAAEFQRADADHGHGDAHAASLHDDGVAIQRDVVSVFFAMPPRFAPHAGVEPDRLVPRRPIQRLASRAPPPGDPARAPPLV